MASMKMKEQLEEQEEKPIIRNCQEIFANVNTNESNLAKSSEELDKESTNLPYSRRHRKLPAELNREIFYCLKLTTRRKFIWGLGWHFYAMFRQILLVKSKRICNPPANGWNRSNENVTVSEDGLIASNKIGWQKIYAEKGFPISGADCRMDGFPGTICYYYEVKILKSSPLWYYVGLTDGEIAPHGWIGRSPNSYAMAIPFANGNFYHFFLAGQRHDFEFHNGGIRPDAVNVAGCGILLNTDKKLTIFFTVNGILIGRQFPINPTVGHLFPATILWGVGMSLEANFGDNPAKPFEYDTKKCSGMGLEWI